LACCRYAELNPVRAGIIDTPEKVKWSSYKHKVGIEKLTRLDLDPCYKGLGRTEKECEEKYKEWIKESLPESEWELIRQAVH
jgi:putative transposase